MKGAVAALAKKKQPRLTLKDVQQITGEKMSGDAVLNKTVMTYRKGGDFVEKGAGVVFDVYGSNGTICIANKVDVDLTCDEAHNSVDIVATCRVSGRTGVEMEALTAVSVAALTVYDMCKAVDRGMRISDIKLVHKAGGKSGEYRAETVL